MSKYERFIIYPLLLVVLIYGFIGNTIIQARPDTEVFNRIEAQEIVIKNDKGIDTIYMGSNKSRGFMMIFDENIVPSISIGDSGGDGGVFILHNKDGIPGVSMDCIRDGGSINVFNKIKPLQLLFTTMMRGG